MTNLNLIRKVAWSFHKTTGLPFEELFSEASLAYAEAFSSFDPQKNIKFSTWAYKNMRQHLINFVKREYSFYSFHLPVEESELLSQYERNNPIAMMEFRDWLKRLPSDLQTIAETVLEDSSPNLPPKKEKGKVIKKLREKGWSWPRIRNGIRGMKEVLNEI